MWPSMAPIGVHRVFVTVIRINYRELKGHGFGLVFRRSHLDGGRRGKQCLVCFPSQALRAFDNLLLAFLPGSNLGRFGAGFLAGVILGPISSRF